jgi:hypothetical protein
MLHALHNSRSTRDIVPGPNRHSHVRKPRSGEACRCCQVTRARAAERRRAGRGRGYRRRVPDGKAISAAEHDTVQDQGGSATEIPGAGERSRRSPDPDALRPGRTRPAASWWRDRARPVLGHNPAGRRVTRVWEVRATTVALVEPAGRLTHGSPPRRGAGEPSRVHRTTRHLRSQPSFPTRARRWSPRSHRSHAPWPVGIAGRSWRKPLDSAVRLGPPDWRVAAAPPGPTVETARLPPSRGETRGSRG